MTSKAQDLKSGNTQPEDKSRRDFIVVASYVTAGVGAAIAAWPLINQMNPAADTLALASIEVDISKIEVGQSITVKWRGKPVFIRHRTVKEITEADDVKLSDLRDPQTDAVRVENPNFLIVVGVCTHLGCVPLGQKIGEPRGDYDGWFCPCHGSHYDSSGRIRKGPAPLNLAVPAYVFASDKVVRIG